MKVTYMADTIQVLKIKYQFSTSFLWLLLYMILSRFVILEELQFPCIAWQSVSAHVWDMINFIVLSYMTYLSWSMTWKKSDNIFS